MNLESFLNKNPLSLKSDPCVPNRPGALTVPNISILQHSELRARPHMHMNIVNNSFEIVLTPSLRQVSLEHFEPDQYVFLLFIS